jgi:hypothetical protein
VSIESDIVDKIVDIIDTDVPEVETVSFDKIKLATTDFADHELPAVQLWDNGQVPIHERGRIRVDWNISLELIMKSEIDGIVDQKGLFELRRKIQLALWANPNLGIPGVVHLIYTGNISDLHLLQPHYIARIDFAVQYYDDLTGSC